MPEEEAQPQVEMQMQPSEFAELRAAVAAVSQQDVHLGRVLDMIVLHLGHAHGLDPAAEDAKAKAAAEEEAKAAEAATAPAPAPAEAEAPAEPAESEAGA